MVDSLITKLAKPGTKVLRCYNKADLVPATEIPVGEDVVRMSARHGLGMDALLKAIENALGHSRHQVILTLPYAQGGLLDTLHKNAKVNAVDYTGDGIVVDAVLDDILYGRLKEFITKE